MSTIEVFLCYAHTDEQLLNKLKTHLRPLQHEGLISFWYDRKIGAGEDWKHEIDMHQNSAQIILLLVSPNFMDSDYCYSIEMKRAIERHERGETRVIPIILRPVDWQSTLLGKLQVLPKNGKPITRWPRRDDAFFDIAIGIRQVVKELIESFDLNPFSPTNSKTLHQIKEPQSPLFWNVPYARNPFFTGREDVLTRLHETLTRDNSTALTQVMSGLGGVGKTQTAVEYAYRYCHEYQAVLWIRAESHELLLADFMSIADILNLPEKNESDQKRVIHAVKYWFQHHKKWLLIIDNVDNLTMLEDFIPPHYKGKILLTTRLQAVGRLAYSIKISKMKPEEGALFLLRCTNMIEPHDLLDSAPEIDRMKAIEISQAMDGLPLALDQAGAYIEETACGLSGYLKLYQMRSDTLLKIRGKVIPGHPEPVFTMLTQTFEKIQHINPASTELLRLCTFLHSEAIPEEIIIEDSSENLSYLGPDLHSIAFDPFAFNIAIGELLKFSLIQRDADAKVLSIHRLVQDVIRNGMDKTVQQQWAERAVRAINRIFPDVDLVALQQLQRYLPHAQICISLIDQFNMEFVEAGQLLYQVGNYFYEYSHYNQAEHLYEKAMTIYERGLGPKHAYVATCLDKLAHLYYKQNRYEQAEPLYRRALTICENTRPPNYTSIATILNNLAELYKSQSKYDQATRLYQQALTNLETALGPSHPYLVTVLENYTDLLKETGQIDEAVALKNRSHSIQLHYMSD